MPIPKRRKDESKNKFIERCMSNDTMKKEFPKNKQRLAVCHSQLDAAGGDDCGLVMRADMHMAHGEGGKRPSFSCLAYAGGAISPDSPFLDAKVIIDLSTATSPDRIAANLNHDYTQIVGQTDSVKITSKNITMKGKVTGDWLREGDPSEQVITHAKGGFVWPVSLGASIGNLDFLEGGETETVNGAEVAGPIYVARRVRLRHIAFLSDPADQEAMAEIAAKRGKNKGDVKEAPNMSAFEKWLKALGFEDASELSEDQRTNLEANWKNDVAQKKAAAKAAKLAAAAAAAADDDDGDDDVVPTPAPKRRKRVRSADDNLNIIKAERDRKKKIDELSTKYAGEYPDAVEAIMEMRDGGHEDETMTTRDFENLLLRECTRYQRLDTTVRTSHKKETVQEAEFEAALCKLGGMSSASLEKTFKPEILEASDKRWRFGLSLREFLEFTARSHGFSGSFRSEAVDVMAAAMPTREMRLATGPSTYDVSGILGNVLNRFVVDFFMSVDLSALNMITAKRPVTDFRQISSYSLTGDLTYEKVEPGGEIKHGTFGESGYTNQADTYGKMVAIDRRDLINDDIGALSRISQRLGRGGALALADVFWTLFINNSAFFTTARLNLVEGATTALGIDSLSTAKTQFNLQIDPDGKSMTVPPSILLVPPELEATAKVILQSQLVVIAGTSATGAAADLRGNANIHSGTLGLAMARELSNSTYTGESSLKWYTLASPGVLPVIETCFLNGREMPIIENAQADFETLGIKMRGYFDFGCGMQEYRGGVAMKGEA